MILCICENITEQALKQELTLQQKIDPYAFIDRTLISLNIGRQCGSCNKSVNAACSKHVQLKKV